MGSIYVIELSEQKWVHCPISHFAPRGSTSPGNLRIASSGADIYASSTRLFKEPIFKHLAGQALVKRIMCWWWWLVEGAVQRFFPCAVFDPKSAITDLETTYTGIVGIRFRNYKNKNQFNKIFLKGKVFDIFDESCSSCCIQCYSCLTNY